MPGLAVLVGELEQGGGQALELGRLQAGLSVVAELAGVGLAGLLFEGHRVGKRVLLPVDPQERRGALVTELGARAAVGHHLPARWDGDLVAGGRIGVHGPARRDQGGQGGRADG
jgi:Zn-dependent alcohol dehydrogenase